MGNSVSSGSRRQQLLVALVGHISSPVQKEVDSGLCVLSSLANAEHVKDLKDIHRRCHPSTTGTSSFEGITGNNSSLRVFLPFIKSLLEDVRMLMVHQQRILFRFVYTDV
eukprot:GHVR01073120.1.p1 GENE.GHVR01073120.1~~GHVR01073120.1.p1  ORF type:complete len:110 (+),score=9.13 GHVR01073120.1:58-387(+)